MASDWYWDCQSNTFFLRNWLLSCKERRSIKHAIDKASGKNKGRAGLAALKQAFVAR